jgi:hypothetical protein
MENNLITLNELGNHLPIPTKEGEKLSFTFKPWRMAEEKQIGKIKQQNRHLGKLVREIFTFMLEDFGGKPWGALSDAEQKLLLNQMSWGNIFYMYIYLRYDALGDEMKMVDIQCPNCTHTTKEFTADLNSLEVKVNEGKYDEEAFYNLKKPFRVGEIDIEALRLGYTPWDAMEKIKIGQQNEGDIKENMIRASLLGAVGKEVGNVDLDKFKLLEQLTKRDIEGMYNKLDEHNGGPILGLDVKCEACGHEWHTPMNWSYDYFFGSASQ